MACRKGWSREILVNNFTQKFVTRTYKARREDLLFEREKSLMPATLPYVEIEKKIRATLAETAKLTALRDTLNRKWADRKSTRLNSSHSQQSRMPSSA